VIGGKKVEMVGQHSNGTVPQFLMAVIDLVGIQELLQGRIKKRLVIHPYF